MNSPSRKDRPEPLPVVAALILEGGQWLLAQRPSHKHLGGKWEFPGGKVDPGETAEHALVREIREELGCQIELLLALAPYDFDYGAVHIRLFPHVARLSVSGPRPVALEHVALQWLAAEDVACLDLAPADRPLLAQLPALAIQFSNAEDVRR